MGVGGCEFKSRPPDRLIAYVNIYHYQGKGTARENMLELVFILPLAGIIHLTIAPRSNSVRLKKVALGWSLLTQMATILLWGLFDGEGQFQAI